jgi:hypothetical protein
MNEIDINALTSCQQWQKFATDMILKTELQYQQDRLNQAKNKAVIFSPFVGEFGHRLMHHTRLVHFIRNTTEKIVCCKPGEEVLYPTATAFEYDWIEPLADADRHGTDRGHRDWPLIVAKYPNHQLVQSGNLSFGEEWHCIEPQTRIQFTPKRRNLKVDVCIGTRHREGYFAPKNWPHCQLIADAVKAQGLTFATIGGSGVSYHLDGEQYHSGDDFRDVDAAIELIQNCQLYFSQDSGCAHLASTVGCNMAVLDVPDIYCGRTGDGPLSTRTFYDRMKLVNPDFNMLRIDRKLWNDPQAVVNEFKTVLKDLQPRAQNPLPSKVVNVDNIVSELTPMLVETPKNRTIKKRKR